MASSADSLKAVILESLVPDLMAAGYDVFVEPSRSLLPPFMRPCQLDAIALKPNGKLAIKVVSPLSRSDAGLGGLAELFSSHPDWEFRVIYAAPHHVEALAPPSRDALEAALERLPAMLRDAGPVPTLLTAWAALEGAARALLPEGLERPQTVAHLLEVLAFEGYLTPSEAERVRHLGRLRNKAAHGDFSVELSAADLADFISVIRTLIAMGEPEKRGLHG